VEYTDQLWWQFAFSGDAPRSLRAMARAVSVALFYFTARLLRSKPPMYVEMGLSLIKLGEEARVPLADLSLEGGVHRNLRRTNKHALDAGCTFEMVDPPLDDGLLQELKIISDAWLTEKQTAEKQFSLGFFQPDYLRACPAALVRQHGRVIAFANVWRGANQEELSGDLMRYLPDAPDATMEFLFIQLMLWGKQRGY
jgi:phosphatidylglycerol lysyltransferase